MAEDKGDWYPRAKEIWDGRKGTPVSSRMIIKRLAADGYVPPTPQEMRFIMSAWLAEERLERKPDGEIVKEVAHVTRQIDTGSRVLRHIDRYLEDRDIDGLRDTMFHLLDVADGLAEHMQARIPHIKVETIADLRAMSELARHLSETAKNISEYTGNVKAASARDADGNVVEAELLPPERKAVDITDRLARFKGAVITAAE